MSVIFHDSKVLFAGSQVAMDTNCCCYSPCSDCNGTQPSVWVLNGEDGEGNPIYEEYAWHSWTDNENGTCTWKWYNAESQTYWELSWDKDTGWQESEFFIPDVQCVDGTLIGTVDIGSEDVGAYVGQEPI